MKVKDIIDLVALDEGQRLTVFDYCTGNIYRAKYGTVLDVPLRKIEEINVSDVVSFKVCDDGIKIWIG